MLTSALVDQILNKLSSLHIGVVGDLFLDQYLELDGSLTEPSIETGLDAYQVAQVRNSPGAAGTILNNLHALGVGHISLLSFVGADGRGYDVRKELMKREIDITHLLETPLRQTPTYTKPMLHQRFESQRSPARELNRLDIRNLTPTPGDVQLFLHEELPKLWNKVDALLVLDQVSLADTGVVTSLIRHKLSELGQQNPRKLLLADSRELIHHFKYCWTKPNLSECQAAFQMTDDDPHLAVMALAHQLKRPVFCTRGSEGICLANTFAVNNDCAGSPRIETTDIPGYPVNGPIDIVGAGDSTSAGIACAYAAGASLEAAASFGNLVASITIQQLGTTGTATPQQVRDRWQECHS
jgi:bifunctional ADP-heptose synthase (sugar kinase/adenylyltransferase)